MSIVYEKKDDECVERIERLLIDKQQLLINKIALEEERDILNSKIAQIDQILEIMNKQELEK